MAELLYKPDEVRKVGPLEIYRSTHWRRGTPMLTIFSNDRGNAQDRAYIEMGALGTPVLAFDTGATKTFRTDVHAHRKQLETVFILWR